MCSNCGRLLVGVGDFCPYCGFPRPKLTEALDHTGQIPRVRTEPRKAGVIGRRLLGITLALACVAALVAAGLFLFRPAEAKLAGDVTSGVVPDQPHPPDATWSKPRAELFTGMDASAQVTFIEPGRTDAAFAAHLLATATDKSGRSQLISLNLIDGSVRWRVNAATPFHCAERMVNGGVVCLYDSQLRIVQLESGNVARTFTAHVTSRAVTVVGDHLVVLSGSAISQSQATVNLQSFAPNGDLEWTASHTVTGSNFGLSRQGGLVAVTGVSKTAGSPIVHLAADGAEVPLPAGTATLLPRERIAVSKDGVTKVYTKAGAPIGDLAGRPLLYWPRDRALDGAPVVVLKVTSDSKQTELVAYTDEGNQVWTRASQNSLNLGYCNDRIVLREPGSISVLERGDGNQVWTQPAAGMQPLWCDGTRAITFVDGVTLAAYQLGSGKEDWRVRLGTGAAAPTLVATTRGFLAVGASWIMYK